MGFSTLRAADENKVCFCVPLYRGCVTSELGGQGSVWTDIATAGCDLCDVVMTKEREGGQDRPICLSATAEGQKSRRLKHGILHLQLKCRDQKWSQSHKIGIVTSRIENRTFPFQLLQMPALSCPSFQELCALFCFCCTVLRFNKLRTWHKLSRAKQGSRYLGILKKLWKSEMWLRQKLQGNA